jgi:hypothetical protein
MKYLVAILLTAHIAQASADDFDHGYYRADGSYVINHHKQSANDRTADNHWNDVSYDAWTGQRNGQFNSVASFAWR